jgi:hypothetical protein
MRCMILHPFEHSCRRKSCQHEGEIRALSAHVLPTSGRCVWRHYRCKGTCPCCDHARRHRSVATDEPFITMPVGRCRASPLWRAGWCA